MPVGKFKIGSIAQECKPHLTNSVQDDPRVSDKEWAKREGMVAFADYPLMVGSQVVGAIAMFARKPLSDATLKALELAASEIAMWVKSIQAEKEIVIRTEPVGNHHIRVRIRDNGSGITAGIKNKIFEPFFTTKPVGQGSGLGLSICYQIVAKHGGGLR